MKDFDAETKALRAKRQAAERSARKHKKKLDAGLVRLNKYVTKKQFAEIEKILGEENAGD